MLSVLRSWMPRVVKAVAGLAVCCSMQLSSAHGGDWRDGGLKALNERLDDWGVAFSAAYIGETLGNASGGIQRGTIYDGRLDLGIDVDRDRAVGWKGGTSHGNVFQLHGQGLSRDYIGNLMLVSGIEALPSTRLYEFWIEQSLLG